MRRPKQKGPLCSSCGELWAAHGCRPTFEQCVFLLQAQNDILRRAYTNLDNQITASANEDAKLALIPMHTMN